MAVYKLTEPIAPCTDAPAFFARNRLIGQSTCSVRLYGKMTRILFATKTLFLCWYSGMEV